jgi:hypothetical protein
MVQYSICDQESSDSSHKLNAKQCSIGYFRMKRIAGRHVRATWGCDDLYRAFATKIESWTAPRR